MRIQALSLADIYDADTRIDVVSHILQNPGLNADQKEDLYHKRHEILQKSSDGWLKFHKLISCMCELAFLVSEEFPRDAWQVGTRIHVDKAYVYNVHTRSSIV